MPASKFSRKFFTISIIVVTILVLGAITAQVMANTWVKQFLDRKLPPHVDLKYDSMETNIFTGSIALNGVFLKLSNRDSVATHTEAQMKSIALNGLEYSQFFMKDRIVVSDLKIDRPQVVHDLYKVHKRVGKERRGVVTLLKEIEVERLKVEGGELTLNDKDSLAFHSKTIDFDVFEIKTGPKQIRKKIPVTYGKYDLLVADVFVDLGSYEKLNVNELQFHDGTVKVLGSSLQTKYGKSELSKHLKVERDYVDLQVPEITLESIEVSFVKDTLNITTGNGKIIKPVATIYRDKLVTDDTRSKKMYSGMLRNLPIYITVPSIEIENAQLQYGEKIEQGVAPGSVSLNQLNAQITNISNRVENKADTKISADALLMDHAPIRLDWSFQVNTPSDNFIASGEIKNFKSNTLNSFLESSLRAKAKGTINRLYFTIGGNAFNSSGDIKMRYEDFEFSVLKKNRLGVNKLLTFLGNLFINDGSKSDEDGFRYGDIEVERDPTKSFFNYLWMNVKEGMVNTMVGKGKKED